MQQAANARTTEESSDDIHSSDPAPSSSESHSNTHWNFIILFILFFLSLDILLYSRNVQTNAWNKLFIDKSPRKGDTPQTLLLSPTDVKSDTSSYQLQTIDHDKQSLISAHTNAVRNLKVIVAAITLEVLGALALKFLVPSVPITSILAGLMTTRRVRFLAKLKQWLMFLPKIARFEKKFKKLSMTLKTLQKGLKSVYSQQKHDDEEGFS